MAWKDGTRFTPAGKPRRREPAACTFCDSEVEPYETVCVPCRRQLAFEGEAGW